MHERDHGRRRYARDRYEDERGRAFEEDDEARYGYGGRQAGPGEGEAHGYGAAYGRGLPRPERGYGEQSYGERRDLWRGEGPYESERQAYGEAPYGPAHSPAHMGGSGRSSGVGWTGDAGAGLGWGSQAEDRGAWSGERSGDYAGRGPKGYRRSRERILDDVAERLTRHPEIDASELEVDVDGDVVVLRGRVYDRRQKRLAEDVAESVGGVRDVRNELDVDKGILETLTDAVTGRSDEERVEESRQELHHHPSS